MVSSRVWDTDIPHQTPESLKKKSPLASVLIRGLFMTVKDYSSLVMMNCGFISKFSYLGR